MTVWLIYENSFGVRTQKPFTTIDKALEWAEGKKIIDITVSIKDALREVKR
jgi:hypothetical protein